MTTGRASPRIVAIFLVKFDVRRGNSVVWSKRSDSHKGNDSLLRGGIEFRVMPSGLHSATNDVVYFVQPDVRQGKIQQYWDGVAVFQQSNTGKRREDLEMYSLGVLCSATQQEEESRVWIYSDALIQLLSQFMEHTTNEDGSQLYWGFEQFFQRYSAIVGIRPLVGMPQMHPIQAIKHMLVHYGPVVFEVWKAVMLRQRVMLSAPGVDVQTMCQYVYVLSILGAIPSDISHLVPQQALEAHGASIPSLYSVSLPDQEWLQLSNDSYVVTTRDAVLLDLGRRLYDLAVVTDHDTGQTRICKPSLLPTGYNTLYPTARSRQKFQVLVETLGVHDKIRSNSRNVDIFGTQVGEALDSVTSVFSQTSVNGFLWWASAGEQSNDETEQDLEGLPLRVSVSTLGSSTLPSAPSSPTQQFRTPYHPVENDVSVVDEEVEEDYYGEGSGSATTTAVDEREPLEITAIGYFHQMTRRLFKTMASIIQAQDYENGVVLVDDENGGRDGSDGAPLVLYSADLRRMGLDAFAQQDREFAVTFVKQWWGRDSVVATKSWITNSCCGY